MNNGKLGYQSNIKLLDIRLAIQGKMLPCPQLSLFTPSLLAVAGLSKNKKTLHRSHKRHKYIGSL
jgi:hypothetical protein